MLDFNSSEILKQISEEGEISLPLIPMRGLVVLPKISVGFEVNRSMSTAAVQAALKERRLILLAPQFDPDIEKPKAADLTQVACLCSIVDVVDSAQIENLRVRAEALIRCEILEYEKEKPYFRVKCKPIIDTEQSESQQLEAEACRRAIVKRFQNLIQITNRPGSDMVVSLLQISNPSDVVDIVATNIELSFEEMLRILVEKDPLKRLYDMLVNMEKERQLAGFTAELEDKVREAIDEGQKEYYLREQLKVIHEELGEGEDAQTEVMTYMKKLESITAPEDTKERLHKEIQKFSKMPPAYPDTAVARNYLDLVFELPWGKKATENINIAQARAQLDADHYGLEKVKERLLEYLAIRARQMAHQVVDTKAPILCLVGPPGVGKTSVAMSIAKALGRPYVRMSLGGVRDEADIRGHRRTYVGALPGRVINAIKTAKVDNPLILLDEVDKLGNDYHGDPSSALLEVLDPEQNKAFHDHYLELDYNLSNVLFLTTANSQETIPLALLDRMEVIELNGYTEEEKYNIAKLHLWPKQMTTNVVSKKEVTLLKEGLMTLIREYTREAGVRQLEQMLAKVCRRIALEISEQEAKGETPELPIRIRRKEVVRYLGKPRFRYDKTDTVDRIGQATGLAWTAVGGETLTIEVAVVPGTGKLELTGHLGQVMQESAKVALAFIRTKSEEIGLANDFLNKVDIHVHVPEGATPKDGPSAGITLATALYSALAHVPVRHDLAMTGEITIRGRVLPIGGLKEKLIAAHRAGIKVALIPSDNVADIDELPNSVRKSMEIIAVDSAEDVFAKALLR